MKVIALQTHVGNDNKQQMMTSLEIAELTGKQHNHLMRDIRNMERAWEKVTQSKFGLSTYKDSTGRTLPRKRRDFRFLSDSNNKKGVGK